tara:strand:- start:329 stop:619 length:291 start_codon:yes stop_codon:yes gene_type:complete
MKDIAIRNIYPNVTTLVGEIDATDKDGNVVELDESKITTEITRLEAEWDANSYQRDRQYPTWQEQMDMQYWDSVNGTTTWKDAIAKVKTDNPKPAE